MDNNKSCKLMNKNFEFKRKNIKLIVLLKRIEKRIEEKFGVKTEISAEPETGFVHLAIDNFEIYRSNEYDKFTKIMRKLLGDKTKPVNFIFVFCSKPTKFPLTL